MRLNRTVGGRKNGKDLTVEPLEERRLLASLLGSGAVLLGDLAPGSDSSAIKSVATVGDKTFFVRNYTELWTTQGKPDDPRLLADFREEGGSAWVSDLTEHANKLVFRVETDESGEADREEYLFYDPHTEEMHAWMTLNSTQESGYSFPNFFLSKGNDLFFSIYDDQTGSELWKANGDLSTVARLKSFGADAYVEAIRGVGSQVFISGYDMEVWSSDGTEEGTKQIRDVTPAIVHPFEYSGVGDLAYGQMSSLATADFDSDGALDYAVPGEILFGDGQGGVLRRLSYGDFDLSYSYTNSFGIQVIDIDLDGDQDVAVALTGTTEQLQVYLNDGVGQLVLELHWDMPDISRAMAIGPMDDIDGDDLLVAAGNTIYRLSSGNAIALEEVAVATQQILINQLQAKDLDGDGRLDLVVSDSDPQWWTQSRSLITVLKQTPSGTFDEQARSFISTDFNLMVNQLAVADWNADGLEDIVFGQLGNSYYYNSSATTRFGVILQSSTGFDGPVMWNSLPGGLAELEVLPSAGESQGFVLVGVRNPHQWFLYPMAQNLPSDAEPIAIAMDQPASSIATGDLNGDGLTDFAIGDGNSSIITYTNFGAGSFGIYPSKPLTGETISSVAYRNPGDTEDTILTLSHVMGATQISRRGAVSEVDGAPAGYIPELVLAGQATKVLAESLQGSPAKDLLLLFPDGPYVSLFQDGDFLQDQRIALGSGAEDMVTGDWNGDGRWDLAVTYPAVHRVVVYQQNLQGSFTPSVIRDLPGGGWQLLSVDVDSDGDEDLLTPDASGSKLHIIPAVSGGFGATQSIAIPGGPQRVQLADMDHVGMLDLVATTADFGMIVALRDAFGDVYSTHREEMTSVAVDLDLIDISGDGWVDVIVTPSTGTQALIYYGATYGEVGYAIPQWVGVGMRQVVAGVVEGDAIPGIFMLLQTLPDQGLNQNTFGFMVEMRPDILAAPLPAYTMTIPRDSSTEKGYFLTYREEADYYYGSWSSF
ncbi:MAG: FG-GAP repeat domain-containing protein, partial [Pirellulaceae bacterium]